MINVTNAFREEAFEHDNRNYQYSIRITFHDDSYIDIGNESLLGQGGVIIDEAVSSDDKLGIGTAIVNKLTLVLQNYDGEFDQYDFQKANVVLKIGLLVNGQLELFQRGVYIVSEPPVYNQSSITLVCYDYMSLFDVLFSTVTIAYPTTVGGIIDEICDTCGVERHDQTIPNEDLTVQSNPASDTTTCREMLSYIGQISGTNARMTNIGKLQFVWYADGFASESEIVRKIQDGAVRSISDGVVRITYRSNAGDVNWVNQENIPIIYTLDASRYDTIVTGVRVVLQGTADTDIGTVSTFETGTDDYLVSIENNPIANADNAEDILAVLAVQLIGFKYRKASLSHVGIPWVQAGDSALIADANGSNLNILFSSTVFTSLDRQITVSAGSSEAVNNPSRFSIETVQRTKTLKDIKPVIQTLNQRINNAGGLYETRITDQQGATITYLHNKVNLSESDIQIKVSDVGVVVTSNGTAQTPTWYGLTVDGTLIANILSASGINADWITTGRISSEDDDTYFDLERGYFAIEDSSHLNRIVLRGWSAAFFIQHRANTSQDWNDSVEMGAQTTDTYEVGQIAASNAGNALCCMPFYYVGAYHNRMSLAGKNSTYDWIDIGGGTCVGIKLRSVLREQVDLTSADDLTRMASAPNGIWFYTRANATDSFANRAHISISTTNLGRFYVEAEENLNLKANAGDIYLTATGGTIHASDFSSPLIVLSSDKLKRLYCEPDKIWFSTRSSASGSWSYPANLTLTNDRLSRGALPILASNIPSGGATSDYINDIWLGLDGATLPGAFFRKYSGTTIYCAGYQQSDEKLKCDIADIEDIGEKTINAIEHKSFTFKANGDHRECGYIAQQLQKVIPDAVVAVPQWDAEGNPNGETLCINDHEVLTYTTKAVQELSAKNRKLEDRVEYLENRLNMLENTLEYVMNHK